jgi:hypothetical protein
MNKKKEHEEFFDPMGILKNINCMFFGACDRKQLEEDEE